MAEGVWGLVGVGINWGANSISVCIEWWSLGSQTLQVFGSGVGSQD